MKNEKNEENSIWQNTYTNNARSYFQPNDTKLAINSSLRPSLELMRSGRATEANSYLNRFGLVSKPNHQTKPRQSEPFFKKLTVRSGQVRFGKNIYLATVSWRTVSRAGACPYPYRNPILTVAVSKQINSIHGCGAVRCGTVRFEYGDVDDTVCKITIFTS